MTVLRRAPSGGAGAIDHITAYTPEELADGLTRLASIALETETTVDEDMARFLTRDIEVVGLFLKALHRAVASASVPMVIKVNHDAMEITAGLSLPKAKELAAP